VEVRLVAVKYAYRCICDTPVTKGAVFFLGGAAGTRKRIEEQRLRSTFMKYGAVFFAARYR
jgi:hypothetical protein